MRISNFGSKIGTYNKWNTKSVLSINADRYGCVYIGTINGVQIYDEKEWETIQTTNSGLPGNRVMSILIDDNGNKWFGTNGVLGFWGDVNTINTE